MSESAHARTEPAGDDHAAHPARPSALLSRGRGRHRRRKSIAGTFKEIPVLVVTALALALLIKTFLVQAFYIPSPSMAPTLLPGDRVLVNKLAYDFAEPKRGDVVVFENPNRASEPKKDAISAFFEWLVEGLGISQDPNEDFIKRVIGLPGDTVRVTKEAVYVNDRPLEEPYVKVQGGQTGTWRVPEGKVFVMGDNRPNSSDSRAFPGGAIEIDSIVGKAFVRIWPPSRMGGL